MLAVRTMPAVHDIRGAPYLLTHAYTRYLLSYFVLKMISSWAIGEVMKEEKEQEEY